MSLLRIPVTASSMPEWVRRVGETVNAMLTQLTRFETDLDVAETTLATLGDEVNSLRADVNALSNIIKMTPSAAPASPAAGWIYFDSGTNKLMIYDGTIWQAAW